MAGVRLVVSRRRTSAMSWLGEVPTRSARMVRSSLRRTWMTSAPSTTWALVRTSPSCGDDHAGAGRELDHLTGAGLAELDRHHRGRHPLEQRAEVQRLVGQRRRGRLDDLGPDGRVPPESEPIRPAAKPTPPATSAPTMPPATAPRSPGRARCGVTDPGSCDPGGGGGRVGRVDPGRRTSWSWSSLRACIGSSIQELNGGGERRVPENPRHTGNWKRASDVSVANPRGVD